MSLSRSVVRSFGHWTNSSAPGVFRSGHERRDGWLATCKAMIGVSSDAPASWRDPLTGGLLQVRDVFVQPPDLECSLLVPPRPVTGTDLSLAPSPELRFFSNLLLRGDPANRFELREFGVGLQHRLHRARSSLPETRRILTWHRSILLRKTKLNLGDFTICLRYRSRSQASNEPRGVQLFSQLGRV